MDNQNTKHDDAFFEILKECKTLPTFLDAIFGFLNRRTDFYHVSTEPESHVGLPPKVAEHFVKKAFFKWKPPDSNLGLEDVQAIEEVVVESEVMKGGSGEPIQIPCKSEQQQDELIEFTSSESYNGAAFETYTWSQTISDIDIIVKLPENTTTKNLSVIILPKKVTVKLKNCEAILLDGELCQKVKHNDAIWSLDKQKLEIHLDKVTEMWWDCLVQTDPKLDVTKIDCSRPFEELPEEAQAKIEELTWNEEQKRLGLPTKNQIIMREKFKNAWDAEGCPFTEPLDLSSVMFTDGN